VEVTLTPYRVKEIIAALQNILKIKINSKIDIHKPKSFVY